VAVRLHRCRFVWYKVAHPCWTVQKALDEQGIEYEIVTEPTYPRGRRKDVIEHTGQPHLPAIEFEDGSWYREESKDMAAEIRAGRLLEKMGRTSIP
jgi:glutathione S-transferase-like protein